MYIKICVYNLEKSRKMVQMNLVPGQEWSTHMDVVREGRGMNWEAGIDIYTRPCVK